MSTKTNLILDITIFTAFFVIANPSLTGMEWLALAFAAAIVTHLLFHWNWLVTVTKQFFKKLFHQSRLKLCGECLVLRCYDHRHAERTAHLKERDVDPGYSTERQPRMGIYP